MSEELTPRYGFGTDVAANAVVPLDQVRGEAGEIRCQQGHLLAKLTKDPDVLFTGGIPVNLSDSGPLVLVHHEAEGCVDQGFWDIVMVRLRPRLRWRRGKLRLRIADVGQRSDDD